MDITQLPFNRLIGIESCGAKEDGLLQLSADSKYQNHVGTVHASALFGLAEASSGAFLVAHLKLDPDSIVPILRRADIKYRKPATGYVYAKGVLKAEDWEVFHDAYTKRQRALIGFQIDVLDQDDVIVATAHYEWFVTARPTP